MNNAMPEVFPKIVVDIEYGKFVDYIDLDLQKISDHLKSNGLTDSQINNTTIHFRSKAVGKKSGCTKLGRYNPFTKKANIFGLEVIGDNNFIKSNKIENPEQFISHTLVHELEHRIASFDKQQAKENRKYHLKETFTDYKAIGLLGVANLVYFGGIQSYNQIANTTPPLPVIIGGSVLVFMGLGQAEKRFFARHNYLQYRNRPEEIRAENAANNFNDSLITLKLKQNP